jgi:hypothetical protein
LEKEWSRERESWDSQMDARLRMDRDSRESDLSAAESLPDEAGGASSFAPLSLALALSLLLKKVAMKDGAAGLSFGRFFFIGRLPITPTCDGETCGFIRSSSSRISSSADASVVCRAEGDPATEGRREGALDHVLFSGDQTSLDLEKLCCSEGGGQRWDPLSVEGRGISAEAIDAGRGLPCSRSNTPVSAREPPNGKRLLVENPLVAPGGP